MTQRCVLPPTAPNTMTFVFDCTSSNAPGQASSLSANYEGADIQASGLCNFQRTGRRTIIVSSLAISAANDDFRIVSIEVLDLDQPGTYALAGGVANAYLDDDGDGSTVGIAYAGSGQVVFNEVGDRITGQLTASLSPLLGVGQGCAPNPARCGSFLSQRVCHPDTRACAISCGTGAPCPSDQACEPTSVANLNVCQPGRSTQTAGRNQPCDGQTVVCEAGLRCLVGQQDAPAQGFCRASCPGPNMHCDGPEVCISVQSSNTGACIPDPCSILSCFGQTACKSSGPLDATCVTAGRISGRASASAVGLGCSTCGRGSGTIPGISAWSANGNGGLARTQARGVPVVMIQVDGTLGGDPTNPASMQIFVPAWAAESGPASFSFDVDYEAFGRLVADGEVIAEAVSGTASLTLRSDGGASGSFDVALEPLR